MYVNALLIELQKAEVQALSQVAIHVHYDGKIIGEYFADIVVEDCVIVEVKAAKNLSTEHEAQLLNYLKATKFEVGLLMNFGPKPAVKRLAFSSEPLPGLKAGASGIMA